MFGYQDDKNVQRTLPLNWRSSLNKLYIDLYGLCIYIDHMHRIAGVLQFICNIFLLWFCNIFLLWILGEDR